MEPGSPLAVSVAPWLDALAPSVPRHVGVLPCLTRACRSAGSCSSPDDHTHDLTEESRTASTRHVALVVARVPLGVRGIRDGMEIDMESNQANRRTDRLGVLLDQFDWACGIARARLGGLASPASLPQGAGLPPRAGDGPLTDEEYLWEPAPGAWSIRRRGEAVSPRPYGPGEWQIDSAEGDLDPTPVTTIAWRLGHLHSGVSADVEWTFGERRRPPAELVDFTPSAAVALQRFWAAMDRWRDSVAAVTPEQLDTVGFDQNPNSDAAESPFITVVAEANVELIHHMAEIALLRDLYRVRARG